MGFRATARQWFKKIGIPKEWALSTGQELSMVGIRLYAFFSGQRGRLRALQCLPELRLMFGCGNTRYQGWTGIDCYFGSTADLLLDLRRSLPFAGASVDLCYSEHFLEHLYPEEAVDHLRDVARILKPGGVYRIVVPDTVKFFRKYIEGDTAFFQLAYPWAQRPMQALYDIANLAGRHRNILDFGELQYLALQAGFASARQSEAGSSDNPALRIDRMQPQRIAESLYVELCKAPAAQ